MVLLQLRRCMEVFTQRNYVADFIRLNFILFTKTTNSLFEPSFGGVRGNIRTSSVAPWKARGRLHVRYNWTFLLALIRLIHYKQILVEVGVFQRRVLFHVQVSDGWGHRSPISVSVRKVEWLPFHVVLKYRQYVHSFRHNARVWWTNRRTDRITIPETALA